MFFMNEAHEKRFAEIYLKKQVKWKNNYTLKEAAFIYLVSCIDEADVEMLLESEYQQGLFDGDEALLYECALDLLGKEAPKHELKELIHLNDFYMQIILDAIKIASKIMEIVYAEDRFIGYVHL